MLKQQLRTGDVLDETILTLFQKYPREDFVPTNYKSFAYSDMQIPLPHGQEMMSPLEEGKILQALNLRGDEHVLEVGTGTGYLTTLLANLAKKVTTVEYFDDFYQNAKEKFNQLKLDNIEAIHGDGCRGWMEKAPYDVIILTGSIAQIAPCFKPQLMKGGQFFAVIGEPPAMHGILMKLDDDEQWHNEVVFETNITPLVDKTKHDRFVF